MNHVNGYLNSEWQDVFILVRKFQVTCKLEKLYAMCDSSSVLESGSGLPAGVEKQETVRMLDDNSYMCVPHHFLFREVVHSKPRVVL